MKIGILSDIHGHLDSLNKALDLFAHLQVDKIICVGDLVDRGPDGDAVVEIIRKMNIPCVQGNHDELAMRTQDFLARHLNAGLPIEPLTAATVNFLSGLPLEYHFEWMGISVYLAHANPWHDSTRYIYPTESRSVFESIIQITNSEIIILGHTHRPMYIQIKNAHIINPGSVFANYGPYEQTCGVLHLPQIRFDLWDVQTGQQLPLSPTQL